MKLIVLESAQAELEDAQAYYLQHSTPALPPPSWRITSMAQSALLEYPLSGTPISPRLRALPMRHFPYSLIYRATVDTITIRAIAHQRRRPRYWSGRR